MFYVLFFQNKAYFRVSEKVTLVIQKTFLRLYKKLKKYLSYCAWCREITCTYRLNMGMQRQEPGYLHLFGQRRWIKWIWDVQKTSRTSLSKYIMYVQFMSYVQGGVIMVLPCRILSNTGIMPNNEKYPNKGEQSPDNK